MTIERMDNVGIVVHDLDVARDFFTALGMELEGEADVEARGWTRPWASRTSESASPCATRTGAAGSS